MSFILRVFFMGLIAFVPSRDGKELTVLLVETSQGYTASNGDRIAPHNPLLLARAGKCCGHCGPGDAAIARVLFPGDSPATAVDSLSAALLDGAAWRLNGSDLSIVQKDNGWQDPPSSLKIQRNLPKDRGLPKTSDERMDFDWVANLGRIKPAAGAVDPDVLACRPQKGLIVARLRLRSGTVWTYRLVRVGDKVLPLEFKTLRGVKADYSQALADWVVAEIQVSGDEVEVVEHRFGREEGRAIRLAPQDGLVELAVMNIPPPPAQQPGAGAHQEHEPATHFEMYYNLARTSIPKGERPVPRVAASSGVPGTSPEPRSKLLDALKLGDPKGFYDRILCPVAQLSESGNL
jgi:hypothetical protein